jgi:hypothetical protein
MYCSSCGVAVTANLTYCNHCGAKVNSEKSDSLVKTTELRFESLIMSAMVGLFVLGLVAISVLLGVMKAVLGFPFGPLVAFAFFSFSVLIALEGVLTFRLFRGKRDMGRTADKSSGEAHITKELEAQSRILAEPVSSVTDHTTRTLDPIHRPNTI